MENWPNRSWRRFWRRGKRLMQAVSISTRTGFCRDRFWHCLLWVWMTWWACLPVAAAAADRPPNIVVIIADDLGWKDVGYHGSEIRTPHIDKLATAGVRLERHYVYPTCSPTRAGLLTGRNPSRFGIHGPIAGRSEQSLPSGNPRWPAFSEPADTRPPFLGNGILGFDPRLGRASMDSIKPMVTCMGSLISTRTCIRTEIEVGTATTRLSTRRVMPPI